MAGEAFWLPLPSVGGGGGGTGGLVQAAFDIFGPTTLSPLTESSTGGYDWTGDAVTANGHWFNFDQEPTRWTEALYVHWRVVWIPGDSANGIRLVHADSGPTNITEIHEFTGLSDVNPIVSDVDITTEFNALLAAGAKKFIGHQTTAGATSIRIYSSRIDVVWEAGGSTVAEADVRDAGRWETVVTGNPAEAVTTEDGTDWLYTWVTD